MEHLASLGQELYLRESLTAVRLSLRVGNRIQLVRQLTRSLRQPSPKTRVRVAEKLIQRLVPTSGVQVVSSPLLRLVAAVDDAQAQQELIFHRAAITDRIVAALATDIFYPHFIQERAPRGMTREQFRSANTAALFELDKVVTRRFIFTYARSIWQFESEPSLTRALRILRQGGVIRPITRTEGRHRVLSFVPTARPLSEIAFDYLLYEDCLLRRLTRPAIDQVQGAEFARIFLQTPLQVTAAMESARQRHLLRAAAGGRFNLACESLEDLVERLLKQ